MSEKYTIKDSLKQAEILNETENIPQEYIDAMNESLIPDYIRIINYLQEQEEKNKTSSKINLTCTILGAIFAAISAIPVIMQIFTYLSN